MTINAYIARKTSRGCECMFSPLLHRAVSVQVLAVLSTNDCKLLQMSGRMLWCHCICCFCTWNLYFLKYFLYYLKSVFLPLANKGAHSWDVLLQIIIIDGVSKRMNQNDPKLHLISLFANSSYTHEHRWALHCSWTVHQLQVFVVF